MVEFLATDLARAVMLFTAVAALIVISAYIVSKWRGTIDEDNLTPSELLTSFRELHSKGELTDEEFRTIKAKLSYELQQQLKGTEK